MNNSLMEKVRSSIDTIKATMACVQETTSRFSGSKWFDVTKSQSVSIVGCGGIGSHLSYMLAKLNLSSMKLFDGDNVEQANMGTQMFMLESLGMNKVLSCIQNIHSMVDESMYISSVCENMTYDHNFPNGGVFVCTDNIESRRKAFELFKMNNDRSIFIDGRCTYDRLIVYAVQSNDIDAMSRYEASLLAPEEIEDVPCGEKQTAYIASMTASIMTNLFTNWMTLLAGGYANIPFRTEFDATTSRITIQ